MSARPEVAPQRESARALRAAAAASRAAMSASAAAGTPVRVAEAAAGRTTELSLAYLRCAERGELPAAADALIAALGRGDAAAAARSARALARWGATSGRALMLGMDAAARRCRARPAPAPRPVPPAPSARR